MKKILATIVIATYVFGLSGVSFASLNLVSETSYSNGSISGYVPVLPTPPEPKKTVHGYVPVLPTPPEPKKTVSGYVPVLPTPPEPKKTVHGYVPVLPTPPDPKQK